MKGSSCPRTCSPTASRTTVSQMAPVRLRRTTARAWRRACTCACPPSTLTLAGFVQGGQADTMTPGPLLAAIVDTVTGQEGAGLAGCSDDQLVGIISAARRMQSRCAWTEMAAMTRVRRRATRAVARG